VSFEFLLPSPRHFQLFYLVLHDGTYHIGGNLRAGAEKATDIYLVSHDGTYHIGGNLRAGTEKETDISMTAIEEVVSLILKLEVPGLKLCL